MDSPLVTQLFRQLFSHRASQCLARGAPPSARYARIQRRGKATRLGAGETTRESRWTPRQMRFPQERADEFDRYPMVTSDMLKNRRERPRRVKMLLRDFIEDSLYNPNYGYFSKQVVIFSPGKPFDFNAMASEHEFFQQLRHRYTDFEDTLDYQEPNDLRQLWHTPTELFSPYYGEALARYLVEDYKYNFYPYHDLNIYEMGAGNGTMMLNILDYIRDIHPEVYERTKFKIVEISSALARLQQQGLGHSAYARGHADKVDIINRSIFEWDTYVSSPCYFLALEVFDNFGHDALKYDHETGHPYQSHVVIDPRGELFEYYSRTIDPVAAQFLDRRDVACKPYAHSLQSNNLMTNLRSLLPFKGTLSEPEYIPTRLMQFFYILYEKFPNHKLISSDFNTLSDTVEGLNAPVVQTRYKRQMIAVTTPLVHQGYFDILFPTDFDVVEPMYTAITGRFARTYSHEDFMAGRADIEETQTKNGENPLLSWYKNASVMITL
ncbi:S-adenosyl-L-methionine-dependent methyltransferase [Massariosphaeria phaeospora]|uniref:Protein arginine methyltransferase NDUFAF7 n=1 Tax=Massariosphaeria phaeospora TaxID=100035 RepID=A0A7C8IEN6_9PLEO|nr:S-adenosyl-L-methionine-dependent methyltransferase [Massariosphaeria phaeospora]